jgi:hypothetical protein
MARMAISPTAESPAARRQERAALARLAILQQDAALAGEYPWRDACAFVRLTPTISRLIQQGLAAFSSRPANRLGVPDLWAVRVTSRGHDVLPMRVRLALVLGGA